MSATQTVVIPTGSADPDRGGRVETRGVETVPEVERDARPRDIVAILLGSNLAFSVMVFGWLPVAYGLGFWASICAVLAGTALGAALVAPLGLLGHCTATNNSVSSGAVFGVLGRLIGSAVGLLLCLGYTALTIWTGGEALVTSVGRAVDHPLGNRAYAIGYAVLAAVVAVAAIYGFRLLVHVNRLIVPLVGACLLLGVAAYGGSFDIGFGGAPGGYLLGSFWPTWLLAMVGSGIAGPVSYVTLLGDWTRYVPSTVSPSRVLRATGLGLFFGLAVPTVFGVFSATATLGVDDRSYVAGLVTAAPLWYLPVVVVSAVVGSIGQAGVNLYSMGLDLDAILPRLTRVQSTGLVAAVATVLVFLGQFVWNAETAVTTFVLVLTSLATPWATITMIGFRRTRATLDTTDLQVFNRGMRGGRYWYSHGWNANASLAWVVGSVAGVLANSTDSFEGPVASWFSGVDLSVVTSAVVAAVLFVALERLRPSVGVTAPTVPATIATTA
jgi:purine-cytosine permease-like protein